MMITTLMSFILIKMIFSKPHGLMIENFTERKIFVSLTFLSLFTVSTESLEKEDGVPADGQYLPSVKELCSCIEASKRNKIGGLDETTSVARSAVQTEVLFRHSSVCC